MPKGYNTLNSPYGRKARVAAIETGQPDIIDWWFMSREERAKEVPALNPLGKIPALVLDDGTLIVDSPVIAAWVDAQHDGVKLIPDQGNERWAVLSLEALGDGLGDAAIAAALESNRPEGEKSQSAIERNISKVNQTLSYLNDLANEFNDPPKMGEISVACAMGYMELRGVAEGWREKFGNLAAWYERIQQRESFKETAIPEGY